MSPSASGRAQRRVPEAVDGVLLGERRCGAACGSRALVDAADALVERAVGGVLQLGVERGRAREAALVERLRAVARFELRADVLEEVRRDRRRPPSADRCSDDRPLLRLVGLLPA